MYILAKRNKGGDGIVCSSSPVIHPDYTKACVEAERLAKLNPAFEFVVFHALAAVSVAEPPVKWTSLDS